MGTVYHGGRGAGALGVQLILHETGRLPALGGSSVGLLYRLPEIKEMVGDYRIVEKLGSGSYGHVYKAEQDGHLYAVKILHGRLLHDRARREIGILLHLKHPGVVRFIACGYWPNPIIGHSYIVMEYAGERTLERYVQEENPSARRSARIMLDTALTLGEVLRQGAMHRDLKPDNIIIRDVNARPLLIDFGVGALVGAPAITSSRLPPGTLEFRAPEAWRFSRENDSASYDYGPADELWALGVTFYWLLTDVLPFGDREDEEGGGLVERILHQSPIAPHVLNPRVPRALSDICMKMLEKDPAARYASVAELCAALDSAMADAELDASWDLPLIDPDAPHNRTTEEDPALVDPNDSTRWLRRWMKKKRRRGQKPPEKSPEKAGAAPAPVAEVLAAVPVVPPEPVPPEPVPPPAPQAPAPDQALQAIAAPRPPVSRHRARLAAAAGVAAVLLGVALVVKRTEPASVPTPVTVPNSKKAAFLLPGFTDTDPSPRACFVREVALPWKPLESAGGAVPVLGTSTAAPFAIAMLLKDDTSLKTEETRAPKMQRQGLRSIMKKGCVGTACCVTLTGCPGAQVRPTPEPEPCPAGAVETMERLGIDIGDQHTATFLTPETGYITVQEGDITLDLFGDWGKLPQETLLFGRLIFSDGRVYGRLTEAKVPGGETFKVCMEMRDLDGGRGAIREPDGGPESARIFSTVDVRAVSSFE
jgi:eukaryotic-like serine/threonine-protein kinase